MFTCYLILRLKACFRLLREIGVFRSCFVIGLLSIAVAVVVEIENRWVVPVFCLLLLSTYHIRRKDKEFLIFQIKKQISFLQKEYFLLGSPFIGMELIRGNWLETLGLAVFLLLLPYGKGIKVKRSMPVLLPFLYKGGMEYIRMFRRYGWLYVLLWAGVWIGMYHGNGRFAKVCFLLWGVIQATAFSTVPDRSQIFHFRDFRTFYRMLGASIGRNVLITGLPVAGVLVGWAPDGENVCFSVSVLFGTVLYLMNLGLLRQICHSEFRLGIYQFLLLMPLFFFSSWMPYLFLPFIVLTVLLSYVVSHQLTRIWKS